MKTAIHPTYFSQVNVVCSCGNTFTTGSTREKIHVEVCFNCHPLYTGEKRYLDTLGSVERFQKKQQAAETWKAKVAGRKEQQKSQNKPKSLRELMAEMA